MTSLLGIPYRSSLSRDVTEHTIPYSPHIPGAPSKPTLFTDKELVGRFSRYQIATEGSFVPEKMEIRGQSSQKGNGETKRIVILGSTRMQYKVFKLTVQHTTARTTIDEDISMS
jgi:hypothetical protein